MLGIKADHSQPVTVSSPYLCPPWLSSCVFVLETREKALFKSLSVLSTSAASTWITVVSSLVCQLFLLFFQILAIFYFFTTMAPIVAVGRLLFRVKKNWMSPLMESYYSIIILVLLSVISFGNRANLGEYFKGPHVLNFWNSVLCKCALRLISTEKKKRVKWRGRDTDWSTALLFSYYASSAIIQTKIWTSQREKSVSVCYTFQWRGTTWICGCLW